MKTVIFTLVVAVAAVAAQQPLFRVTASSPLQQAYQSRPSYVAQPYVARQYAAQPYITQQANYRRPYYRQDVASPVVPIVSQSDVRDNTGYAYSYETGDRTTVQERGLLKPGPEGDYIVAEGSFSFVGTDGVTYTINYKADENGFQAEGAHIPKTPEQSRFVKK